jgi:predicted Fe-Mo cluster-binding NifX family protein
MKIAISTDRGFVSEHFGRCPSFTLVEIEDGRVVSREEIRNPGHNPGYLPQFFSERGVTCIVAGGMGRRAMQFFSQFGIDWILGAQGPLDDVIDQLAKGTLEYGESTCAPGRGRGYGVEKNACDHPEDHDHEHEHRG